MHPKSWEISMKHPISVLIGLILALGGCGETPAPTATSFDTGMINLDMQVDALIDMSFARDAALDMDPSGIDGSDCAQNEDCDSGSRR